MVAARDDAGGELEQRLAAQVRGQRLSAVDAAAVQVALAAFEQAHALGEGRGAKREADAGAGGVEAHRGGRNDGAHPQRGGTHPQAPPAPGDGLRDVLVGLGELAQEATRAFERHRPEFSQTNAGRQALEERGAGAALELGDGAGERGLGHLEPLGRGHDAPSLGDGEKLLELASCVEHRVTPCVGAPLRAAFR